MGGSTGPYQNPPYANAYSFTSDNITPVRTLATGFPDNSQPVDPADYRGDWTTIDPDFRQGRVQQWSINVEREVLSSTIVSVAYAGSYADRLFDKSRNLNTAPPGPRIQHGGTASLSAATGGHRRNQPRLDEVQLLAVQGWSGVRRRVLPSRRYTYSKALDKRRVRFRWRPGRRLLPGRRVG